MRNDVRAGPPVRAALSRHPVAVECANAAASLSHATAEITILESDRAFVVASSQPNVLQPRLPTETEHSLLRSNDRRASGPDGASFAIIGPHARTVGALSVLGPTLPEHAAALEAMARMVSALIGELGAEDPGTGSDPDAALDELRDAVVVVNADLDIIWANRATGSLVGRSPAEVTGRSAAELLHPDDLLTALDGVARLQAGLEIYRAFVRISRPSGGWERAELTGVDNTSHPGVGGIVLSLRAAEVGAELGATAERPTGMSEAVVAGLHDGIIATDESNAITLVNPAARLLFGVDKGWPASRFRLDDFVLLDETGQRRTASELVLRPRLANAGHFSIVLPGDVRHVTVAVRAASGVRSTKLGTVLSFHDMTDARRAAEELRHQALHDQLTGLPNRRLLEERLAVLAGNRPTTIATCFIDIDRFKLVNDTYGHRTGDLLIRIAAERIRNQLGPADLLTRQGGDEFVAVLADVIDVQDARRRAERIRSVLGESFMLGRRRFELTASVGVAITSTADLDEEATLRNADIALYAAKERGRNRTEVFDDELARTTWVEEQQRSILRDALANDRVMMHFQPLIDAQDGATFGYEALVRLRTEDGKVLGPATFLDAAETAGQMWELDTLAFDLSCQAAAALANAVPDAPPVIACNFSGISLAQTTLVDMVESTTSAYGVAPSQICIEVTESAAFDAGPAAVEQLRELHERGYQLALDDFGTGYSSLAHLRDLPISSVKVDKSFVRELTNGGSERAIAEAMVTLARDLGLSVVAEGVETPDQLEQARALGFSLIQGWHYAPALPLSSILATWIDQEPERARQVLSPS